MIPIILGLIGVPLWLLAGWILGRMWHRHVIKQLSGAFQLKVRMVSGTVKHIGDKFALRAEYALWARDSLITEKGMMMPRLLVLAVTDGVEAAQAADHEKVKGLGDSPVTMRFKLDDGAVIEIAAKGESSALAQGPFFSNTTSKDDTGDVPADSARHAV